MFPYTLLPDGQTLEPEDVVKPPAETPAESTLTQSPHLDFGNPPPPPAPEPNPFPTIPPGLHVPPPPTVQPPQPESTSQPTRPKQDAAAQNREPSLSGFPQDIGWSPHQDATGLVTPGSVKPDIGQDALLEACGYICEQNPEAMTAVMNIIEGFDPDDDEQTLRDRVENYLGIIGLNDAFGHGDWYTTRLGPAVKHTATRIVDYYFDQVTSSESELRAALAAEHAQVPDEQQVKSEAPDNGPQQLNYHTLEHLRKYVDGWDDTWTTENDVSNFIITHWADTYGVQVPEAIVESPLEVQLAEFLLFVEYHRESYFSATWQYESPYPETILTEDYNDFLPLLALLNPRPLNDLEALLDVFEWQDEADAVFVLRRRVEAVFSVLEEELPADWEHMSDAVEMANMLYAGIEDMLARSQSDSTFLSSIDPATLEFGRQYDLFSSPGEDFQRLARIDRSADHRLFMLLLSLWEPADYVLTIPEILEHIEKGEFFPATVNAGLLILPGFSGKMDNAADLIRRFDVALDIPGVNWFVKRHDLMSRGIPEQAVEEIVAGRATRPRWGAGHGKLYGPDEKYLETASEITRREYDVGEFLANELGYEVVYMWPDSPSAFVTHVHRSANYQGKGFPDFFIMHPGEDGQIVLREFDVYSPTTNNLNTIFGEIKDKVRQQGTGIYAQADRIVLDLSRAGDNIAIESLERRLKDWNTDHLAAPLKEIFVVGKIDENFHMKHIWTFN